MIQGPEPSAARLAPRGFSTGVVDLLVTSIKYSKNSSTITPVKLLNCLNQVLSSKNNLQLMLDRLE